MKFCTRFFDKDTPEEKEKTTAEETIIEEPEECETELAEAESCAGGAVLAAVSALFPAFGVITAFVSALLKKKNAAKYSLVGASVGTLIYLAIAAILLLFADLEIEVGDKKYVPKKEVLKFF